MARGARAAAAAAAAAAGGGGGARLRSEARLPLSPRTLCASGAGSRGGHGAAATVATGGGIGGGTEEASTGLPDEPMVHVERSAHQGTWMCCVPCYWLRRSKAVHKALLTFAMLLVISLLVTSPVLFLITTLPEGEQPRNCAPLVSIHVTLNDLLIPFFPLCFHARHHAAAKTKLEFDELRRGFRGIPINTTAARKIEIISTSSLCSANGRHEEDFRPR